MSNPYGYGAPQQGQPPGVLPPPQATPWQQAPQQFGPPQGQGQGQYGPPQGQGQWGQQPQGQWGQPQGYGSGGPGGYYQQFNGFGPPPPRRGAGRLKLLMFGAGAFVLVIVGVAVLLGSLMGDSDDPANPGRRAVSGPSIVPTPNSKPEAGTAEDIMVNSSIFRAGGLGEMNCKAEPLGDGQIAAQKRYYQKLFKCLNDGWRPVLKKAGFSQPDPGLVVFDKPVSTPCGDFEPKSGRVLAFYCYGNNVMYTDVLQMNAAFGVKEDLAYLMTIAHEYGHHIQGVTGLFYARASYVQEHPNEKLDSSRRNELQASCFAGVFSRAVEKSYPLTGREKEFEYQSGNSFGDSEKTPEDERTHGKASSQGFWIMNGLNVGETKACNTFAAPEDIVR